MELLLQRKPATGDAILGTLLVNGVFEAFTMERLGVEIAPGRYEVIITPSERFGRLLPEIIAPPRTGLRFHPLNWAGQSDGCIGLGQEHTVTSIEHSKLAMAAFQPKIAGALAKGERVFVTIEAAAAGQGVAA